MTWTKDLINSLDVFNVSTNLNLTNQHFVNMTKKMQTDLDMTNQHFVNMTKKMQTDLDLTNQHLVNITKKMQTDLVKLKILPNVTLPEMQEVIGSLDFLNVTQLNIRRLTDVVPEIYRTNKLASAMRNLISGSFSQATRSTIWATCFGVFHDYC